MKVLFPLMFMLFAIQVVLATDDSTKVKYQLREVEIRNTPLHQHHRTGFSIAEQLGSGTNVFIRQFSPGSLATATIRGSYNVHTPVIWNGFDISSPLNSQQDLSLMPAGVGVAQLQTGNLNNKTHQPNIGGAIQINTPEIGDNAATVLMSAGSFGMYYTQAKAQIIGAHTKWQLTVFDHRAANNFTYYLPESKLSKRRSHAGFTLQGLVIDNEWRPSKKETISTSFWLQHSSRQLPGSIFAQQQLERQNDAALRFSTHYSKLLSHSKVGLRLGAFKENFYYIHPKIGVESNAISYRWQPEAYWQMSKVLGFEPEVKVGTSYQLALTNNHARQRTYINAPYSSIQFQKSGIKWAQHLFGRVEYFQTHDKALIAPSGMWRLGYHLSDMWSIKGAVTYKYRLPTLNEMYWQPNGNIDIEPEQAQNNELGLSYNSGRLQFSLQAYNNYIRQHIAWQPVMGFWSPFNIGDVQARGAELDFKYSVALNKWMLQLGGMSNYTRSSLTSGPYKNLQMIYMPTWNNSGFIMVGNTHFGLTYRHQITGKVFTTFDHAEHLEAFQISSIECHYTNIWPKVGLIFETYLRANNLFNQAYSLMPGFPMPGRTLQIGILFQFKRINQIKS